MRLRNQNTSTGHILEVIGPSAVVICTAADRFNQTKGSLSNTAGNAVIDHGSKSHPVLLSAVIICQHRRDMYALARSDFR